jgi:hypothetical protein
MKIKFLIPALLVCISLYSQDTTKTKLLNHEIGFNTVSLIKQMISNNPSSSLPQLPYSIFYNLYYKNLVGLRVGFGMASTKIETEIEGQNENRITENKSYDLRAGLSYNFIKTKRFSGNVFGDYVYNSSLISSTNTTTVQVFPDPISTLTVGSKDKTVGNGGEIGVGLKYTILKHLSVYTEVPIVFLSKKATAETEINDSGVIDKTSSTVHTNNFQIILPTTIYLVLTF